MRVSVIGGGIAGLCTALDLSLNGCDVTVIEKYKLGSGTTTKCAGMLHSGARYVNKDIEIAKFCSQENKILKKILPFAFEKNNGLFVVMPEYDKAYAEEFEKNLKEANIEYSRLSKQEVLALEPSINEDVEFAFATPDVVINPYLIVEAYKEELLKRNVEIEENSDIKSIKRDNNKWKVQTSHSEQEYDVVINATGSWANDITKIVGFELPLNYIHGSMAVLEGRMVNRIVTACAPNQMGDVIIPAGNNTLFGSTWHELNTYDPIKMSEEDIKQCKDIASEMIDKVRDSEVINTFTGIRTHLIESSEDVEEAKNFAIRRNFAVVEHNKEGYDDFYTMLAGKLSFGRLVAEVATDIILSKHGLTRKIDTKDYNISMPANNKVNSLDIND